MCGRYRNGGDPRVIEAAAGTTRWRDQGKFRPGYKASPTTHNPVVVRDSDGEKCLHVMRWGLIPQWVKDPNSLPTLMFNARGESVLQKPAFRGALTAGRRCVVLVDGFYEWYKGNDPKYESPIGANTQPYYVSLPEGNLMKMAGIFDVWKDENKQDVYSYTMVTIAADESSIAWLHDRIPVILSDSEAEEWLNVKDVPSKKAVDRLMKPYKGELACLKMSSDLRVPLPPQKRAPKIADFFGKNAQKKKEELIPADEKKAVAPADEVHEPMTPASERISVKAQHQDKTVAEDGQQVKLEQSVDKMNQPPTSRKVGGENERLTHTSDDTVSPKEHLVVGTWQAGSAGHEDSSTSHEFDDADQNTDKSLIFENHYFSEAEPVKRLQKAEEDLKKPVLATTRPTAPTKRRTALNSSGIKKQKTMDQFFAREV